MRNEAVTERVARRLRELRDHRGLSIRAVAVRSGLGTEVVSRAERGIQTPNVQTLERLCLGLDVSLAEFFTDGPHLTRAPGAARRLNALLESLSPDSQHVVVDGLERVFRGLLDPYTATPTQIPRVAQRGPSYRARKAHRR